MLRVGLAMGADAAYLMSDRAFGGADTLATSYALAAGITAIERAKANGSWEVLDSAERLVVPADLAAALDARPPAAANFAGFPPSARKQMLAWVALAMRPETRADRIRRVVDAAERNVRARG